MIRINKEGNAFHITSSKLDYNNVRGILGDLDNNESNDFIVEGVAYDNNLSSYFKLFK